MRRALFVSLVAILCFGMVVASAQDETKKQAPEPSGVQMNLAGATLHSLVQFISLTRGKPVLLPDRFPGNSPVDIVAGRNATVPPERVMNVISAILRDAGYVIEETADYVRLVPEKDATAVPIHEGTAAEVEGLAVITVTLNFADASKLVPILSRHCSTGGSVTADEKLNLLIIKDYGANRRAILELLKILDRKDAEYISDTCELKHRSADSLVNLVKAVVEHMKKGAGPIEKNRLEQFSVEVFRPTNSFVLFGHPADIERVRAYIRQFDVKPEEVGTIFHPYKVRNRDVTELKELLESLFAATQPGKSSELVVAGPKPTIIADETNSELIIMASQHTYDEIEPWLESLDKEKAQVLIEAAYMEVSRDKMADIGVELASMDMPGENPRGFWATAFGLSTITEDGRVPVAPPAATGAMTIGVFKDSVYSIPMLIRLAQRHEDVSFVATPLLMTMDNKQAIVTLSEKREYETSVISAEGATREVSRGKFNEAMIQLDITPHVKEETVRLEIKTKTEQFLSNTGALTNITSREAETEVNVPDGSMVVIAGLTRTVTTKTVKKTPVLGDIPGLRFFFRRKEDSTEERNLCIFITPHVFRTAEELVAEAKRRRMTLHEEGIIGVPELRKHSDEEATEALTAPGAENLGEVPN